MLSADLVAAYERLDATDANLALAGIVADALADAAETHRPLVVKLVRGDPFAAWESDDFGLADVDTVETVERRFEEQ